MRRRHKVCLPEILVEPWVNDGIIYYLGGAGFGVRITFGYAKFKMHFRHTRVIGTHFYMSLEVSEEV